MERQRLITTLVSEEADLKAQIQQKTDELARLVCGCVCVSACVCVCARVCVLHARARL